MMNRREAMVRIGALVAAGLLPGTNAAVHARDRDETIAAFASSFEDVPDVFAPSRIRFDRPLPRGLEGTLFRNGPALMQRGAHRYRHWFDGDGMVQSFRLSGQELVHQGRFVQTRRFKAESAAGRFLWPGFGTVFPDSRPVRQPDDVNVANTSVLALDNELLALWEGGSAWKVDPVTLQTIGKKVFSAETEGMPFSAHPRMDPDGRIWNFGYSAGSQKIALYDLAADGQLNRVHLIEAPNADMVHDFAITEHYLVFVLSPIRYQKPMTSESRSFLQRLQWDTSGPVVVLLVGKRNLEIVHRFEMDPFFAFHFGNAYEDGISVRIDVARAPAFHDLMQVISKATVGERIPEIQREQSMQIVLDLESGTARTEALPMFAADFPSFDARHTGRRASRLFMMGEAGNRRSTPLGFGALIAFDHQHQDVQRFTYEDHLIAEEHLFVPSPGQAEGIGWLIGTSFDTHARTTSLSVFDSQTVSDGPICTAHLPYHLPLGLHGKFVAA